MQKLFEDNNRPVDISYSKIRKFVSYLDYKENKDNYEVDFKIGQFIIYAFPILILLWFLILAIAILYQVIIIYNYYSNFYIEKLNISQILPYYQQNIKQEKIIEVFLLVIIAAIISFIFFRIDSFLNLRKLKIDIDAYYERSKNETKKFKNYFKSIILGLLLLIIVFAYLTIITKTHSNNNQVGQLKKLAKLEQKCALNLPVHQTYHKTNAKCFSAQNKLGVIYYLGNNGVLRNYKKAFYLWKKAANNGYPYSELNLGYMYASDIGIKRNFSKASFWIEKAFYNKYANQSIHMLALQVWNQYELWKYYKN